MGIFFSVVMCIAYFIMGISFVDLDAKYRLPYGGIFQNIKNNDKNQLESVFVLLWPIILLFSFLIFTLFFIKRNLKKSTE